MKKLLYIDCCIRGMESNTRILGECFLKELMKRNAYEVTRLVLMDENLGYLANGFFRQREELLATGLRNHPRFRYAHQFAEADRIVIAAPFWDLSFPALLKVYIENVSVDGITFGCNETGCYGICKAEKLAYLTTRGGVYTGSPIELAIPSMQAYCAFFGIDELHTVVAEGLNLNLEPVPDILRPAIEQVTELAKTF